MLSSAEPMPVELVRQSEMGDCGDPLRFCDQEVARWAEFSGDYNPVHFDEDHARLAGLDATIVHGMLALLPVKQAITRQYRLTAGPEGDWFKFRAFFRTPVARRAAARLVVGTKGHGLEFRLKEPNGEIEHIRGSLAPCSRTIRPVQAQHLRQPGAGYVGERIGKLLAYYPYAGEAWVVLDALLFAEFMRSDAESIKEGAIASLRSSTGALDGATVTYQVSHAVYFSRQVMDATLGEFSSGDFLTYAVSSPGEPALASGQMGGRVVVDAFWKGQPIMQLEIGLLAKLLGSPVGDGAA